MDYAEHQPLVADYQPLVDFYHTCEHLAPAAEALWGAGSAQAHKWYDESVKMVCGVARSTALIFFFVGPCAMPYTIRCTEPLRRPPLWGFNLISIPIKALCSTA